MMTDWLTRSRCRRLAALLPALALALLAPGCHGPSGPLALFEQARNLHQKGQNKAAIIQLKNVLQQQPENGAARALLGAVYLDAGDALSAEKELRKALALGTAAPALLPDLGKALLMQGRFDQLLADTVPLAGRAQPVELQLLRANAYLGSGQREAARALFTALRRQQAGAAAPLLGLARLALLDGQHSVGAALAKQALAQQADDIDSLRLHGDLLAMDGERKAAALVFQRILVLRPEDTQAHLDLAKLYVESAQFAEAQRQIDAARRNGPANVLVAYSQALLHFRVGKHKAAQDGLQQVLRVAPGHMPSVLLMGAVQLQLRAYQQAADHLRRYLAVYPQHLYASKTLATLALRDHTPDAALAIVLPLLARHPHDAELLGIAGDAQMQARRYDAAAAYFEQAAALAPASAELRTALGSSQLALGADARAIGELERALALDGTQERAGVLLVLTHLRKQEPARALAAAAAMAKQQPDNPLVFNLQGSVLLALKDMPAARRSFEQALSLDPAYFPALDNLTQIDLAQHQPLQAEHRLAAALERRPGNMNLMLALSKLAAAQGDRVKAVSWLAACSAANPDALLPATLLSALYLQTGVPEKARLLAQTFQASHPDQAGALALLAQVQGDSGDPAGAIDSYAKLAVLQPAAASQHVRVAELQMLLNDRPAALQSLKKALVAQPDLLAAEVAEVGLLIDARAYLQATAAARAVQRRHPRLAAGFKLEADVLMAQKLPLAALKLYEQAYGIGQSGPQMINIHQALLLAGRRADADARLTAWLARHPDDQAALLYLAGSRLRAGQYAQANALYESILRLAPQHVVALNDLAWSYHRINDARALATAEQAARLAPGSAAVLDTLGTILLAQGQSARALALLRQAAKLAPGAADIGYHLGMALLGAGDRAAARRQLQHILAGASDFPDRAEAKALLGTL